MKKQTFIFKTLFVLLLTGGVLTACSSDDDTEQESVMQTGKTYGMTVTATKGNTDSKERKAAAHTTRALSLTDNALYATWAKTEHVYFRDRDNNVKFSGSLQPQSEGATVKLNGTITPSVTLSLPIEVTLIFPRKEWDYTGQVGTLTDIAARYDYATANANISSINGNNVEASQSVSFENQQAIVRFILKDNTNGNLNATSLRISAKGLMTSEIDYGDITITPTHATNEFFAALRGIRSAQVSLTATVGSDTYIYKRDPVTFTNGSFYPITLKMHKTSYPIELANVTDDHIGSVVGQNEMVYPNASAATSAGTVAVAMIAYVGTASNCTHGLAIALTDENSTMNQSAAVTAAAGHAAISGGTWRLPTLMDWQYLFIGCGNGESYSNTPGTVDSSALNSKLASVGTALLINGSRYWSSTNYYCPLFNTDATCSLSEFDQNNGWTQHHVRAVLAF